MISRSTPASESDPWSGLFQTYSSLVMRMLVNRRGGLSAKHYLRAQRLLKRFLVSRERWLKQHTLQTLLDEWHRAGSAESLESTLCHVLERLRDGDARPLAVLVAECAGDARLSVRESGVIRACPVLDAQPKASVSTR